MNLNNLIIIFQTISFVGLLSLFFLYLKQQSFFKQFTKNIDEADLKSALRHLNNQLTDLKTTQSSQLDSISHINKAMMSHYQRTGFIRFNPYSDTGGDQSFCFCLLDELNNGIVITSLHSREQTRIYAKKIASGKIEGGVLSKEEEMALKQAIK